MKNKGNLWPIPRIWPDSTVIIIGGGPSVLSQDLSKIHDFKVIGVNQAYKLGDWVDVCWYGDKGWYRLNMPKIASFPGMIITCSVDDLKRRKPNVFYVGRSKKYGIETHNRTHIAWNYNSGASAINVAYHLGAKQVVLLGFDMKYPSEGEQTHWHSDYAVRKEKNGKLYSPFPRFMKGWKYIINDAKKAKLKIINCTPNSALQPLLGYTDLEDIWALNL